MSITRYLLLFPVFMAGCAASKSYETEAGLTPLRAPVALTDTKFTNYPEPFPADTDPIHAKTEAEIMSAANVKAIDTRLDTIRKSQATVSKIMKDPAAQKPPIADKLKSMSEAISFYERASVIKKKQLEAGDSTDSSGEVAKYLNMSRVSVANAATLPAIEGVK